MSDVAKHLENIHRVLQGGWLTVCCAESVTVGRLQTLLATTSGASQYFVGGITVYNLDQKVRHLGVDLDHAQRCNCVSKQVAREMAAGALQLFQAGVAISVTGYAEPCEAWNATEPFAYLAIASVSGPTVSERVVGPTGRGEAQQFFAEECVRTLAEYLAAG